MAARRLLSLQRLRMLRAASRRYVAQRAGVVSPRQSARTKALSVPSPRDRDANPVGPAADGSASSSVSTLDQKVLLAEEEDDDGDGDGEDASGDWQSTHVNWLSFDLTTVERLATMARRRRTPR